MIWPEGHSLSLLSYMAQAASLLALLLYYRVGLQQTAFLYSPLSKAGFCVTN